MAKFQLKTSTIYCGDNLKMLPEVPDESVDLIYIDPPFNSNRNYEVFWGDVQEKRAFEDRFGDAQAYLDYMRPRIMELYRVLKKTGSFYYHCDWHASHYVKILLDQVFGFNNFRNEIVWWYKGNSVPKKVFPRKHDVIFLYAKSDKTILHPERILLPYSELTDKRYNHVDEEGNRYKISALRNGVQEKVYMKEGKYCDDVWEIPVLRGKESLGYPTQKPLSLLERIITASTDKKDVVLDAFCGCGTTLVAAEKLGRKWIGIDFSPTACRVMSERLWDNYKLDEGKDFTIISIYKTEADLMKLPPFEFQNWACIALGGIPNKVKVGDYGIDGKLYPIDMEKKKKTGIDLFGDADIYYPIQVKQKEKAGRPDMDSFAHAIRRDGRRRGYFVSFDFTSDAIKEIKRLDKEGEIEIIPITVKELLKKEQLGK